jgi:hypothetical protein
MTVAVNPAASQHLPRFITAPGETDVLMVFSLFMLLAIVVSIGVFYFRLHALPEQIAHKGDKIQFQFVAVLSLIALFTHNHVYWILALLIAFIRIPDIATPLVTMARSLTRIADAQTRPPEAPVVVVAQGAPVRAVSEAKPIRIERTDIGDVAAKKKEGHADA